MSVKISSLMEHPKSQILEHGYINVYSNLNKGERRQLFYNRKFKRLNPTWNNSTILLCKKFDHFLKSYHQAGENLTVLDAGCGHGNYVIDEFRSQITWACGVDVDKQSTKKNICLDEIKYSSLRKIPYKDNSFDAAISLWVIEHVEDPIRVFSELYRVLRPGGALFFATPNKSCLLLTAKRVIKSKKVNLMVNKILYGREDEDIFPTLYKANNLSSLERTLKSVGFSDIDVLLNYDPGYTSFDPVTFWVSNFLLGVFEKKAPYLFKQHIVGVTKKPA